MISQYLNTALLVVAILCAVFFGVGVAMGRASERGSRTDSAAVVVCVLLFLALIGGTWPLAQKNGSLITITAVCFALALDFGLLGGLLAGRQLRSNKSVWNVSTFLSLLLIAGLLGYAHTRFQKVEAAVQEIGIDTTATKDDPVADKDCPENLKSIYQAFERYVEDTGGLPAAKWLDDEELTSKILKNEWEHCPSVSNRKDDKYGYAFNIALAGKKVKSLKEIPDAANTPLLYDSTSLAKSAADKAESLPKPGRHNGTNNILYCDGTVKAVAPK